MQYEKEMLTVLMKYALSTEDLKELCSFRYKTLKKITQHHDVRLLQSIVSNKTQRAILDIADELLPYHEKLSCILYTNEQLMQWLGVSKRCLAKWRKQGLIQSRCYGRKWYYREEDVMAALQNFRSKPEKKGTTSPLKRKGPKAAQNKKAFKTKKI